MEDVIIIGGGFAGIAAALPLARARRQVLLLDSGTPRNRFSQHAHGVLGHDGRPPLDLLADARAQLLRYPTVRVVAAAAEQVMHAEDEHFQVIMRTGESAQARRLILASGVCDELPPIPGLAERWGVSVMHCPYCHGYEVADQRLGILATGELSLHHTVLLPDWSDQITLFLNAAVTLSHAQRAAYAQQGIAVVEEPVVRVDGPGQTIQAVVLKDGRVVPIDGLFVVPQTRLTSPIAERLGCVLDAGPFGPFIRTDERKETTVPGVFAAGDAAQPFHSITWAMADGARAGVGAHQSLLGTPHA